MKRYSIINGIVLFVVVLLTTVPNQAFAAFHFSAAAPTGQTLYYKIIADSTLQVRLTYPQVSEDHENYYYGYPKPTGILVIPDSVEYEGSWYRVTQMSGQVFLGCDSLTEVTLPSTISEISLNAFFGCTRLVKVNMPGSIEEIQSFAFQECSSLESINLPEGLRIIWGQAFCLCTSLRRVHLPSTLEEIKSAGFYSSDFIDTVWISAAVPPICGQNPRPAFTATNTVLVVPCGSEQAYSNANGWRDFAEIISDCNEVIYGVDTIDAKVYSNGGQIVVEGTEQNTVTLFDISGRIIATQQMQGEPLRFDVPTTGTYLVKIGRQAAQKIMMVK